MFDYNDDVSVLKILRVVVLLKLDAYMVWYKNFMRKDTSPRGNLANGAIYILSKEFLEIYEERF